MFIRLGINTIILGAALISGGAGGVAGSDTQIQFNSAGSHGASSALTFNGTRLKIAPTASDQADLIVIENAGTNPGVASLKVGNRDPTNNVPGVSGNIYAFVKEQLGGMYVNRNSTPNVTDWFKYSLNPSNVIEIASTTEYEALATVGLIGITEDTSIIFKADVVSAIPIDLSSGFGLSFLAGNFVNAKFTYTGTDPFITTDGGQIIRMDGALTLVSTAGAPLFDVRNMAQGVFVTNSITIGFGSSTFRSLNNLIFQESGIIDSSGSHSVIDCNRITLSHTSVNNDVSVNAPAFIVGGLNSEPIVRLVQNDLTLSAGESLFQLSKDLSFNTQVVASGNIFVGPTKELFAPSSSTKQVIETVVPLVNTGTLTLFEDNGLGGTKITPAVIGAMSNNQSVIIDSTINYNGKFLMFNLTATTFDIAVPFKGDDATGNFDASAIAVRITGHGFSLGDFLEVTQSNSYNGFFIIFNVSPDIFEISALFANNQTGLVALATSLDHTDSRVLTNLNPGNDDSSYICPFSLNENDIPTPIAVANRYQNMVLTGKSGSISTFTDAGGGFTIVSAALNGLLENQSLQILNNADGYSGAFRATNVLTNSFDIPVVFTGVTGGGDFEAGILVDEDIQGFKLINALIGEVEYTRTEPFDGFLMATIGSVKTGAEEDYNFILAKNGLIEVRNPHVTIGVKTTLTNVTLIASIKLVKGDRIKLQVAGVDTNDNITIVDVSFLAQRK